MKKILNLFTFALVTIGVSNAQDCDLPSPDILNTGANMTVMLTPAFIGSLNSASSDAYLVAISSDGATVGSATIGDVDQTAIAVWGDDSSTDELDGAVANESITFQLVDGTDLSDVTMPSPVVYTTNSMSVQLGTAVVVLIDCSVADDVLGCTDAGANNFSADATLDDGSCAFGTAIEYQLSAGWNMVGYTGTSDNNGIVEQMDAALGNGAGTENTFQVIKNVSGQFWSAAFAQISTFTPGQGYMMYVNGATTSVNFQQTSGYISGIEYQLSAGWNMVAFTGDVNSDNNIVSSMDDALGNAAGTANTFQVIKNVSGQFWSAAFAQISTFTPGQAYMMYVNGSPTTVNFQQE